MNLFRISLNNFQNQVPVPIFMPSMYDRKNTSLKSSLGRLLVTALLFMITGTVLELYLLDHYEGWQQLIPLVCLGAALVGVVVLFFQRTRLLLVLFKLLMGMTALSGVYGTFLHLWANYEFEQEMKPTAARWYLFSESFSGALPALAPCSLIVLALIGYTYLLYLKQQ